VRVMSNIQHAWYNSAYYQFYDWTSFAIECRNLVDMFGPVAERLMAADCKSRDIRFFGCSFVYSGTLLSKFHKRFNPVGLLFNS
jgi:hypothetical protein